MNKPLLDWPPPYTLIKSAKSKRMTLRISAKKGLEVVVPKAGSDKKALEFLNLKFDWVQKHRHLIQSASENILMPNLVSLPTLDEIWTIKYQTMGLTKSFMCCDDQQKTIVIQSHTSENQLLLLKKWLRQKAEIHLFELLNYYSNKYQLPYNDFQVRFQTSRWGSCSKDKNISLNCKLLFLPLELTHYVIVHELIHTIHLDHSPKFWAGVAKIIPDYQNFRKQLKNIELQMPNWL